jgi:hypothetical protein
MMKKLSSASDVLPVKRHVAVAFAVAVVVAACSGSNSSGDGNGCDGGNCATPDSGVIADGGTPTSDATSDASGDGGLDSGPDADAAAHYVDDPCPPRGVDLNCTDTCLRPGQQQQACAWGCDSDAGVFDVDVGLTNAYSFRLRSDFAGQTACSTDCGGGPTFPYGIFLDLWRLPESQIQQLRVRVEPPFYVAGSAGLAFRQRCIAPPAAACHAFTNPGDGSAYIFVDSTTGPVVTRNVFIEKIPDAGPACP